MVGLSQRKLIESEPPSYPNSLNMVHDTAIRSLRPRPDARSLLGNFYRRPACTRSKRSGADEYYSAPSRAAKIILITAACARICIGRLEVTSRSAQAYKRSRHPVVSIRDGRLNCSGVLRTSRCVDVEVWKMRSGRCSNRC